MKPKFTPGKVLLRKAQSKVNKYPSQKKRILSSLARQPKTIFMLSIDNKIKIGSVAWMIWRLLKTGDVYLIGRSYCRYTERPAKYYSSDAELNYAIVCNDEALKNSNTLPNE
jgi:hypothetical protein